jgi:hypothetical protein
VDGWITYFFIIQWERQALFLMRILNVRLWKDNTSINQQLADYDVFQKMVNIYKSLLNQENTHPHIYIYIFILYYITLYI